MPKLFWNIVSGFYLISKSINKNKRNNHEESASVWFALFMVQNTVTAIAFIDVVFCWFINENYFFNRIVSSVIVIASSFVFGFAAYFKLSANANKLLSIRSSEAKILRRNSYLFSIISFSMLMMVLIFTNK